MKAASALEAIFNTPLITPFEYPCYYSNKVIVIVAVVVLVIAIFDVAIVCAILSTFTTNLLNMLLAV